MKRVEISRPVLGVTGMQVCAVHDATDDEILETCNTENPAGTTHGWVIVCREDFERKNLRPVPCQEHPDRTHVIVLC